MKKVIVTLVAYDSVSIEVSDDFDISKALDDEEFINRVL
jgi:hypothetical protein